MRANQQLDAVGVYDEHDRLVAGFTRSRLASELPHTMRAPGRIIVIAPVVRRARGWARLSEDRGEPVGRTLSRYLAPGLLVVMASLMFLVMTLDAQALARTNRALGPKSPSARRPRPPCAKARRWTPSVV